MRLCGNIALIKANKGTMEEFSTELQELVSQVDNGQSTLFSWGDMREAERQSERHVVEGVSVDWGEVSIRNHLLEGVEGSSSDSVATLVDAAVAYYCGHPDEAHEMVASAVEDKDSAVVLTAAPAAPSTDAAAAISPIIFSFRDPALCR